MIVGNLSYSDGVLDITFIGGKRIRIETVGFSGSAVAMRVKVKVTDATSPCSPSHQDLVCLGSQLRIHDYAGGSVFITFQLSSHGLSAEITPDEAVQSAGVVDKSRTPDAPIPIVAA